MPSKTTKKARRAGAKQSVPVPKDDGTRWIIVRDGEPVYAYTEGLPKGEAMRLADGLQKPAEVVQIGA